MSALIKGLEGINHFFRHFLKQLHKIISFAADVKEAFDIILNLACYTWKCTSIFY